MLSSMSLCVLIGADGVLQAMLLSLGPLQFKNDHLEFRTHPRDLHRDYYFRRINYGNNTHLNISVIVGDDNKAVLFVALDRNDKQFYACDAGCLDAPVQLRLVDTITCTQTKLFLIGAFLPFLLGNFIQSNLLTLSK